MTNSIRAVYFLVVLSILAAVPPASAQTTGSITEITSPALNEDLMGAPTWVVKFNYTLSEAGRAKVTVSDSDGTFEKEEEEVLAAATGSAAEGTCTVEIPQPSSGQTINLLITVQLLDSSSDPILVNGQPVQKFVNCKTFVSGSGGS